MHMLGGGVFSQVYGLLSDGTPIPLAVTSAVTGTLTLVAGIVAYAKRPGPESGHDSEK